MKKLVLAVALAGLSSVAVANEVSYVSGEVMYSALSVNGIKSQVANNTTVYKSKENATGVRLAVGKDFGNARYAVDFTRFGSAQFAGSLAQPTGQSDTATEGKVILETVDFKVDVNSIGLTAFYDFPTATRVKPYAGVRFGVNQLKTKRNSAVVREVEVDRSVEAEDGSITTQKVKEPQLDPALSNTAKRSKFHASFGAVAGVQYEMSEHLAVDAAIEYNNLGKIDGVKVSQYGAKLGLRANF